MQTRNVNLPITVTGRHIELTDAMKDYARKKIEGLHLDYPKIIEAKVVLDVVDFRHHAEILLFCSNHITLEASSVSETMYTSLDDVIDKIARQMRKAKNKTQKPQHLHDTIRHVDGENLQIEDFELDETPAVDMVDGTRTPLNTMSVDEAMLQLQVSKQPFLVFINAENHRAAALYRRGDNAAAA